MKAVPQLGIVLGDETEAEGHAFVGKEYEAPLGAVTIEFQGMGALHITSEDPVALRIVEEAFRAARWHLLEIIAEKRNSALVNAPGADVLGEAASGAAEGEQPPSRPAAPPSNPPDGGL